MTLSLANFPISGPKLNPTREDYALEAAYLRAEGAALWQRHGWQVAEVLRARLSVRQCGSEAWLVPHHRREGSSSVSEDARAEMAEGYRDGSDLDAPAPGPNRSEAYRHGFANARDDRASKPRATAQWLREEAARILSTP